MRVHDERVRCLRQGITGGGADEGLFAAVLERISKEWARILGLLTAKLTGHLEGAAAHVQSGFERRFLEEGKGSKIPPETMKVLRKAKKAHTEMEEEVRSAQRTIEELRALQKSRSVEADR